MERSTGLVAIHEALTEMNTVYDLLICIDKSLCTQLTFSKHKHWMIKIKLGDHHYLEFGDGTIDFTRRIPSLNRRMLLE